MKKKIIINAKEYDYADHVQIKAYFQWQRKVVLDNAKC